MAASAADTTISTTNNSAQTVNAGDNLIVTNTGKVSVNANPAISVNGGVAASSINNSGTIESVAAGASRGIRFVTSTTANVTITNNAGAFIQSPGDAIQSNINLANGTVLIDNAGTIRSIGTGANNGQAIDFNNITSGTANIIITNRVTGVITAADADAIRPAQNSTINNFGLIQSNFASSPNGNASGNAEIDFQNLTGTVNNFSTGVISSVRHGITGNLGVNVVNSGTIIGNDGAGINIDSTTNASITTVVNHGVITGTAKTADGDGIDVDRLITLTNDGVIRASGIAAAGNLNEALAIGGGTVNNLAGGLIYSDQRAITVDDSNLGNAFAAVAITNAGVIQGANGEAIKITSNLSNTLTNAGTILGSVVMGNATGGNFNTVNILGGSKIVGLVDGGSAITDRLVYGKIGLSAEKQAALALGQTVNIGGTLYTGFENFTGSTVRSFTSFAANGQTSGVAGILDNGSTTQSASLATQSLIDQVATAGDVNEALTQLTPTAFQALTAIGINNAFQTTQLVDQRLANVRQGGLAFDASGLGAAAALFNAGPGRAIVPSPFVSSYAGDMGDAYAFAPTGGQRSAFSAPARGVGQGLNASKAPAPIQADSPWGMFLYGNAVFARQGATANSPQSAFTAAGVTAGIDHQVTTDLVLGLLGGYSRTEADLDTLGSTSKINTWLLGGYGSYHRQNWFVNGALVYGRNLYDNTRIALGTTNTSSSAGNQVAAQGAVGADFYFGRWIVTPELGAQYTTVRVDGFGETGPAALVVASDHADSFRSSLGSRFRYQWTSAWGTITPELRASWQHEFLDQQRSLRASFVDQALPGTFGTTTAGTGADFGIVGVGLTADVANQTQLSFGYDFKFGGNDFTASQISGRVKHLF